MTDIPYFDGLMGEEQREITDSIRLLLRQTFILERKYDRRTGRFQYNLSLIHISEPTRRS